MSLNKLKLSPSLVATLYSEVLIDINKSEELVEAIPANQLTAEIITDPELEQEHGWKWLGNNQKGILVIVNYNTAIHLPDEELDFLTNLLSACKLSLGDVAILNKENYIDSEYKNVLAHFGSRVVLLFGVNPIEFGLPVSFPIFQVQNVANCIFLYAPALKEIQYDNLLKSKLWVSLRNIFKI